jgi:hypothetical protein
MADKDLLVIKKSMDLVEHTIRLTSNTNRYPKKYRFSLVDKMANKSMNIYECLLEANRTSLQCLKKERLELITKAILFCDELLFYIELSSKLNIINQKSMEYWSKMVKDVKYMSIKWRTTDRNR